MATTQDTKNALKQENTRLKNQVFYWRARYTEVATALGIKLPVLDLTYRDKKVRVFILQGVPLVLAADALAQLPSAPRHHARSNHKGPQTTSRLRRFGLGQREVNGLNTADLAKAWGTTEAYVCVAFGVSTKARWLGAVTPLGIETLRKHAPEYCDWIEHEAFPAVIARFGKGGTS